MRDTLIRTAKISGITLALAGTIVGLAGFGFGHGWGCHSEKFLRHMIDAHVEELLDKVDATQAQRQQISGMEERLLGDFKAMREAHRSILEQLVAQFPGDQLDMAALDQAVVPQKQAQEKLRQDLRQSIQDLHGILTPTQRQKLAGLAKDRLESCKQ